MSRWTLVALTVCLLSTTAYSHGSCYRGPCSQVPPGVAVPSDPTSPMGASGGWERWWSFNKEAFLYPEAMSDLTRPASPAVSEDLEPVLLAFTKALGDKMSCPERSRVAIAAGCLAAGTGRFPDSLQDRLRELSGDRKQQTIVQASCALALGLSLTDDPRTLSWLMDLSLDAEAPNSVQGAAALALGFLRPADGNPAHRPWTATLEEASRAENATDARACAFLAMGISGDPAFLPFLVKAVRSGDLSGNVLRYAVAGLGKLADRLPGAPTDEVLSLLCRTATRKGATGAMLIALGQWAARTDAGRKPLKASLDILAAAATDKRGGPLAGHALTALARLGAATPHRASRDRSRAVLLNAVNPEGERIDPRAAIALGVLGRSRHLGQGERAEIIENLRSHLVRLTALVDASAGVESTATARSGPPTPPPDPAPPPSATPPTPPDGADAPTPPPPPKTHPAAKAAFALALALLGDRDSIPAIRELAGNPAALPRARGHAAVALALLRDPDISGTLHTQLPGSLDADFLVLGSLSGGLAGDRGLYERIAPLLQGSSPTALSKSLVARAFGKLGDRNAVPVLTGLLSSGKNGGGLRSAGAVALADLYDREGALVMTRLTRDLDWNSLDSTLQMLLRAL